MKVTCKLKSAEKVYARKSYAPNFDFGIFLQTITHDLAATSNAAKIYLKRKQEAKDDSIILN